MVLKRGFQGESSEGQEPKRRLALTTSNDVIRKPFSDDCIAKLEPFIRRVIREEVEQMISRLQEPLKGSSLNRVGTSGGGRRGREGLELCFASTLPPVIFTNSKVLAEDGSPIKIELVDARTKAAVTSGPFSSIKVEIVVLDGDFGSDDEEDWTDNDFDTNIVREREGKKPLLVGELKVSLQEGAAFLGNISFTDNSSWMRSRRFRLGARILQKNSAEMRIREARSGTFMVKDHRGESYKKHYPPSLKDDVWRLKNISRDGILSAKLALHNIKTVKDFLRLCETNPNLLKNITGNISRKIWDETVEHATTSVIDDDEVFIYHDPSQKAGLLLNSIYKVIGAIFDGENYIPLENLNLVQSVLVQQLKQAAYSNVNKFVRLDGASTICIPRALTSMPYESSIGLDPVLNHPDSGACYQDQPEMLLPFNHPSTSTANNFNFNVNANQQIEISLPEHYPSFEIFNPSGAKGSKVGDIWTGFYDEGGCSSTSIGSVMQSGMADLAFSQFQTSTCFPTSSAWTQTDNLFLGSNNNLILGSNSEAELGILCSSAPNFSVHKARPRAGWCKIRAALKWKSVRRDVAARRMSRSVYINY